MIDLMAQNVGLDVNKKDQSGVNALWIATWFGRLRIIRQLLALNIDPTSCNTNGSNALHIAVKMGHTEIVHELMNIEGFPVDQPKHNGVTAIGIAAYKG